MKLFFCGANKEVTGSCHCVEVNGKKILVDCGLVQGNNEERNSQFPFRAREIDAVIVTHAHIDHSGRLPLLFKQGYRGPVYATEATCRLMEVMLMDSAHIQETEASWKQRKEKRAGVEPEEPLYTKEDARVAIEYFESCRYGEMIQVAPGATAVLTDAGHLLGSSSATLMLEEDGVAKKVVFSGDIGNTNQPIIKDPVYLQEADYVVMESTYGNRLHKKLHYTLEDMAKLIDKTLGRGGNVVIPAFAVGRTQELLYHIREMKERKLVRSVPAFPVYLDSPLALEATQIYDKGLAGYADDETLAVMEKGFHPLRFPNLKLCRTTEESIALNEDKEPKVIISASGMCDAGRVRHHLKHNLWRKECTVMFAGFQAGGTLGRILLDGATVVKLFGESIAVNAEIYNFRGLSAHADQKGLLNWIGSFEKPLQRVFIVHGEEEAAQELSGLLAGKGMDPYVPDFRAEFDLAEGSITREGVKLQAIKKKQAQRKSANPAYARLMNAGDRILDVISRNEGGANKDLGKFADQLIALAEKWDR
ncbi:MBL fold metallo-hydrolase [Christensenellaceae bacterium OttesenSCG-928-K19]|nr:MBL fold metallo-hydrolase [Christensenellaceae bacterium OttesenSCG-928-K19]